MFKDSAASSQRGLLNPLRSIIRSILVLLAGTQSVTLHGVVKEFRWNNPHVFIS